jgi:hypothetical protein
MPEAKPAKKRSIGFVTRQENRGELREAKKKATRNQLTGRSGFLILSKGAYQNMQSRRHLMLNMTKHEA